MSNICSKCLTVKEASEFSFRNKASGIKYKHCKDCQRRASKTHYKNNKQQYKAAANNWKTANKAKRKAITKERYAEYRGYPPCNCCDRKEIRDFYLNCPEGFHVDHIITLSKGGKHCVRNLQYLSPSEHAKKSNRERWGK